MYLCNSCKNEFDEPYVYLETHGFLEPPFEKFYLCPRCKSGNYLPKDERRNRYAAR